MRRVYTSGDLDKETLEAEFWTDDDQLAATVREEGGQWVVKLYGGTLDAREFATGLGEAIDWLTAPPRTG